MNEWIMNELEWIGIVKWFKEKKLMWLELILINQILKKIKKINIKNK